MSKLKCSSKHRYSYIALGSYLSKVLSNELRVDVLCCLHYWAVVSAK